MGNRFVKELIADSREYGNGTTYSAFDCFDALPLSNFFTRAMYPELKDETFDFEGFSKIATKVFHLFLTIDKLGGSLNKDVAWLILHIDVFRSKQTDEKKISLIQSMMGLMLEQFLNDVLTAKPMDMKTHKLFVFDEADKDKEYSDQYFSFPHEGKRYTVKTDTFDLTDIFAQL